MMITKLLRGSPDREYRTAERKLHHCNIVHHRSNLDNPETEFGIGGEEIVTNCSGYGTAKINPSKKDKKMKFRFLAMLPNIRMSVSFWFAGLVQLFFW